MPPLGMPLTSGLASGPSSVQHLLTPLYQFVGLCYHRQQGEYTKPTFPGGPHPKDSLMRNVNVIVLGYDRWFQGSIRPVSRETLGLCGTVVSSCGPIAAFRTVPTVPPSEQKNITSWNFSFIFQQESNFCLHKDQYQLISCFHPTLSMRYWLLLRKLTSTLYQQQSMKLAVFALKQELLG